MLCWRPTLGTEVMQANRFTAPLRIIPRSSPSCVIALSCVHVFAAIALLITSSAVWISGALGFGIVLSALMTWRELRAPLRFDAVLYDSDGRWSVTTAAGERFAATVQGFPWCSPWLMVVPLRVAKQRYTLVIAADVTPPDILRRLRIRLRYASAKPATISATG